MHALRRSRAGNSFLSRTAAARRIPSSRSASTLTRPHGPPPSILSRRPPSPFFLPQRRGSSISLVRNYASVPDASSALRQTPLNDLHLVHQAKMVPFAGYSMPVQYADLSVGDSHKWTREKASLFDVSHMVQHRISGPGATALLLRTTPTSIASLQPHHSTLSCLLHPGTGGIVDDTVITRLGPELFYVVTNAACRAKDTAYLETQIHQATRADGPIDWEVLDGWGLIALQGPLSAEILAEVLSSSSSSEEDLKGMYFGQSRFSHVRLPGISTTSDNPVLISRGGYTGEDGFEISLPPSLAVPFTEHLLKTATPDRLRLAGLGARDSLRLEAGMCLYGHDLDDSTTPVEAGLSWVIGKDRRTDESGFHGAGTVLTQLRPKKEGGAGVDRRRVGFIVEEAPAREGAEIVAVDSSSEGDHEIIGRITSGCPSPTLGRNIAMGYIKTGHHKAGTEVGVLVRGKTRKATVTKMPFVASRYWKQAAGTSPA
ncbi:MAG: Aminomethyltransferase, mitochondrial [Caeruleum heppii]|nr:MAG: Aminomethyltransferase, mitochondrial [Caeruleum heppii]